MFLYYPSGADAILLGISRWHTRLPTISFVNTIQSMSSISLPFVKPILCLYPSYSLIHNNVRDGMIVNEAVKGSLDGVRGPERINYDGAPVHATQKPNSTSFLFSSL